VVQQSGPHFSVLKDGFNTLVADLGLADFFQCIGYPCRTIVTFDGQGKYHDLDMKSFMQQELLREGILWTAYHALSWSHKREDIDFTLNAYEVALKKFKAVHEKGLDLRSQIEGTPVRPVFRKVADFNSYSRKK